MGEVQTNEEAQVNVHDLGLFVTVKILDDTPAVPSLEKLCEEHRYSHEWVSSQKSRFIKKVKIFSAKRKTSYLLLFQGCHPILVPGSSSTSTTQDLSSSGPESDVTNRLQETGARQTPTTTKQNKKRNDHRDSLRDLPEWLELDRMDGSEIHAKRLNAKEVIAPKDGEQFIIPVEDGTVKLSGGDPDLKTSPLIRDHLFEEKITKIFKENQKGLHHHLKTHFRMLVMHEMISGSFRETSR